VSQSASASVSPVTVSSPGSAAGGGDRGDARRALARVKSGGRLAMVKAGSMTGSASMSVSSCAGSCLPLL
jgi:hypothetical protein